MAARERKGLVVYLVVSFGLAWAIELGPVRAHGYRLGDLTTGLLLAAVMFTPLLAALVARRVEGSGYGDAGLRWGRWRYHLVAWLLPFALSLLATLLTVAVGAGRLDLSGMSIVERLPAAQQEAAIKQLHAFGRLLPLIALLGALTQGVLLTSIATFGEEFGWRGYLQPRLERLGPVRSLVAVGLIWGLWHAPIIVLGHNYPGHPYSGAVMMVAFTIVLSLIFGWLRRRSGSVLAPTLAHASVNSPGVSVMAFVAGAHPLVGNLTGVIGIALLAAFAAVLWLRGELHAGWPLAAPAAPEADESADPGRLSP